ncbi:MAG: hypothetical protein GY705_05985 [Bacteroidetes bacterium]|nr:hypothetical protein [Bacteroidota bacterium]
MKIALIEPYVTTDSLKSYAEKNEPSHLLGMYNLLKEEGCDIDILDAYSIRLSANSLVEWIIEHEITHAGFTVYDYSPSLNYLKEVISNLPENIDTIIGGPGPTYCMERMIEVLNPKWLVKGQGEKAILDRFKPKFSKNSYKQKYSKIFNTTVVHSASMPLTSIPFERPYSLKKYNYSASPIIQNGCVGKCIFCSGAYQKNFDYIDEDKANLLLEHLVQHKKAQIISPNGPDLTAIPSKANKFIRVLVNGNFDFKEFRPGVRLDTLCKSIEIEPIIWNKLSSKYIIKMESSIESFSLNRLNRLGKNVSFQFLDNIQTILRKIFSVCDCSIVLGRIAIDPTISINEFIIDCRGFRALLDEFGQKITIGGMFMNEFVPLQGTPALEDKSNHNPWTKRGLVDPAMTKLHDELLNNDKFKLWCRLAEENPNFIDRNYVFDEILRVAGERAIETRSECTAKKTVPIVQSN